MNIIVATSRGKGLQPIKHEVKHTSLHYKGGAKIAELVKTASEILEKTDLNSSEPVFVYFVAGLPDVTTKNEDTLYLHGFTAPYQEITFPECPEAAAVRVIQEFQHASNAIRQYNATPVFSTIAPISLSSWNYIRLYQHKTALLKFSHLYQYHQINLCHAIKTINSGIGRINQANGVATPKLCDIVTVKRCSDKSLRILYSKFTEDGVHLKPSVQKAWVRCLVRVIKKNREEHPIVNLSPPHHSLPYSSASESDSEEHTRRAWRTY